uniref:Ig-like domain-containing protein n=1 Tax=Hucho hucho TaxID=62062 RepID=A0A4W5RKH1_9TELE
RMTAFALWIVLLPTAASKFVLKLTPKDPMARVGDSLVLTCKASGCAEAVTFTWASLRDQSLYGKTETNGTVSLQIFNPLGVQHINKVVCKATCRTKGENIQNTQTSTNVNVYGKFSLPKDPTMSRSDLLTEGQESNLTCTVPDVYPAERLIIEWLLGDEVLLKQDEHLDEKNVTSVLKYRPTAQNNGQNVTCRATLDIGIDQRTRETVVSMTVQYSPRNITISENTQVNIGDSFTLTCRAKGNPEPTVLWRKLEQDGRSVVAGEGATLLVEEASWSHGGEYECVAHNVVGNQTAHMTVNVQEKPVLYRSPSGELKAGDSVTITCQSESGPQGNVALRQLTGSQGVELQSNQGHTSTSITVQSLTARDSRLYECQATNPYGKQTSYINFTVRDELYTEIQRTTETVTSVNIGDSFTLTCRAEGNPEPMVLWRKLEQDGRSVVAGEGATLLVEEASWSHGGEYECVAHNVLGNQTAHMTVNVQGESNKSKLYQLVVSILKGVSHCNPISSPPEKPVLYWSPSGELKAGDSVTITCQSESGPQGNVALRQLTGSQGVELQSNQGHTSTSITVQSLTARDSRLYECQAMCIGNKRQSFISICYLSSPPEAPPTNLSVEVFPAAEFEKGQNVTIQSWAMGVPAPSTTLVRLRDGVELHSSDGTFHLVHLGPEHVGLYLLNVTNVVGHQSLSFSLSMRIQGETTEIYLHKNMRAHTHSHSVSHTNTHTNGLYTSLTHKKHVVLMCCFTGSAIVV